MVERVLDMESEPVFKQIIGWVDSFDQSVTCEDGNTARIKFEGMGQASYQLTGSGCRQKWIADCYL